MSNTRANEIEIGVIADTHGLMRAQAIDALRGSILILHAGDIGSAQVLEALRAIAPVIAVRGNNDTGEWAAAIHERETVRHNGESIYLLHDLNTLGRGPETAGHRVIVSGHSHRPALREQSGVLFLNPGSAGPRRFKLPISVARLIVRPDADVEARLIELTV